MYWFGFVIDWWFCLWQLFIVIVLCDFEFLLLITCVLLCCFTCVSLFCCLVVFGYCVWVFVGSLLLLTFGLGLFCICFAWVVGCCVAWLFVERLILFGVFYVVSFWLLVSGLGCLYGLLLMGWHSCLFMLMY